jgi:CBS domain-containing protein
VSDVLFAYSNAGSAQVLVSMLVDLYPHGPAPRLEREHERTVVALPASLWNLPMVPEMAIGLGGRLTASPPAPASEALVRDVMSRNPVVVSVDAPVEHAAYLLAAHRIHGLPVVDGPGMVVGVVSQTDLLRASTDDASDTGANEPMCVGDVMGWPAITVPADLPIREAARAMCDMKVHRLVIVDRDSRPIGVLSATDIVGLAADS